MKVFKNLHVEEEVYDLLMRLNEKEKKRLKCRLTLTDTIKRLYNKAYPIRKKKK